MSTISEKKMYSAKKKFFHILDWLGPNFDTINLKFWQILGNIVVYNLWTFQIDSLRLAESVAYTLCFGWSFFCFGSIETPKLTVSVKKQNKHLFWIVPKLVSVPVLVVSKRNWFRWTPYLCPSGQGRGGKNCWLVPLPACCKIKYEYFTPHAATYHPLSTFRAS